MKKEKNNTRGFTLIETVVAIVILFVILSALTSLAILGMRSLENAKREYVAAKIAQEGIEMFSNKMRNNIMCAWDNACAQIDFFIAGDWQDNLINWAPGWRVDSTKTKDLLITGGFADFSGLIICIDNNPNSRGLYSYNCAGAPSSKDLPGDYTRQVRVQKVDDEKILVQVIVQWKTKRSLPQKLVLEKVLYGIADIF